MALLSFVDTHVTFGTFDLPNVLVRPTHQGAIRTRTALTPNRPGLYTAGAVRGEHRVAVNGRIVLSAGQSMDDAWQELVNSLPVGTIDKLYTRQNDSTFRWAEVETLDPGDSQEGSALDYAVSFLCADPYEWSTGLNAGNRVGEGNLVLVNTGTLATPPTLEVIVSDILGANPSVTIDNTSTGKSISIFPPASATYTLDHRLRTVTRSTGGDARPDLGAASLFFDLAPGLNSLNIEATNCTLGTTTASWRNRIS